MRSLIILSLLNLFLYKGYAQSQKADSVKIDSTQIEIINKMPMDSTHEINVPAEIKDTVPMRKPKKNTLLDDKKRPD